jgi:hypothetical protein
MNAEKGGHYLTGTKRFQVDAIGELARAVEGLDRDIRKMIDGQERCGINRQTITDVLKLSRVALRATGITRLRQDWTIAQITEQQLGDCVSRIHQSFGAPGDWGYEHPIGKALAKMYQPQLYASPT